MAEARANFASSSTSKADVLTLHDDMNSEMLMDTTPRHVPAAHSNYPSDADLQAELERLSIVSYLKSSQTHASPGHKSRETGAKSRSTQASKSKPKKKKNK